MQSQNKPETFLDLPTFPEFVPFSTIDRATYEAYISDFDPYSDYGYTSLYSWSRAGDHYISKLNDNLVLSMQDYMSDKKMISFIGNNLVDDTARTLLNFVAEHNEYAKELYLVPETTASLISIEGLKVEEDEDNHDYILSTEHFNCLDGAESAHTRRKLSQFQRSYGERSIVEAADLSQPRTKNAIRKLGYEWAFMGTEGSVSAHQEMAAIERLLKDISQLNINNSIHCLALYVDDKMEGFCIYEIQADFAIVHFIKANIELSGAADYMMVSTMREILRLHGITKVNHEQDLGIIGLRAAKKRYCPSGYLKKYTVAA